MAAGGGMRHRTHRMHPGAKMAAAGSANLKPRCRIRGLVKSGGRVVKLGCAGSDVKPRSADSAEDGWIYVRGCRIERAGLRFNSQGDMYVPDSEDDVSNVEVAADGDAGVELATTVAADGGVGVDLAPAVVANGDATMDLVPVVAADGAAGVDVAPAVATDGAAGVEMNPEVAARLAKKVLGEDLHPEVAVLLTEVLSEREPF